RSGLLDPPPHDVRRRRPAGRAPVLADTRRRGGLRAASLHLRLTLLLVFGRFLCRLATAEHPSEPAPEPARREGLVDLAVCLRVGGLGPVVVRSFGPDDCAHSSTLARRRRDY